MTPERYVAVPGGLEPLVPVGEGWIAVDRRTGRVERWPHLDYLDRVMRMTKATAAI